MTEGERERLLAARAAGRILRSRRVITLSEGYEIGADLERARLADGWRRVGWKLGFTNQALWSALGLDRPFCAPAYAQTLATERLDMRGLVQPRIEPEIVVGFDRDVAAGASLDEIAASVAWAPAGLEVVHCHFDNWDMSPAEAIADAGLHAVLAIGPRVAVTADEVTALGDCKCELSCDGTTVARGRGVNVLGGPLKALGSMPQELSQGVRAGEIVTTGTLTTALPVRQGQRWSNRLSGPVELQATTLSIA